MGRVRNRVVATSCGIATAVLLTASVSRGGQEPSASDGWVEAPAAEETSASAFAVVRNPTMYDIYLVSAASEIAGKVELRETSGGEAKPVPELTVPAYGKLTMGPDGAHLVLVDLKRPLEADESVPLTITTDGGVKLRVEATVRKE